MAKLQNYNGRFCESEYENAFISIEKKTSPCTNNHVQRLGGRCYFTVILSLCHSFLLLLVKNITPNIRIIQIHKMIKTLTETAIYMGRVDFCEIT